MPPAAVAAGTQPPSPAAGRKRRRVLHIEDNPANLKLVRKLLGGRPDVELVDAGSGEVGLALACATTPDLVLLDIDLPGQDGFATLRRLRANAPTAAVPVIAVTTNGMHGDVHRDRNRGLAACLAKPLDVRHFRDVVDHFLDREGDGAVRLDHRRTGAAGVAAPPV
jgi:CheY-like chemotaxis protein